jgi:hypothetical protein
MSASLGLAHRPSVDRDRWSRMRVDTDSDLAASAWHAAGGPFDEVLTAHVILRSEEGTDPLGQGQVLAAVAQVNRDIQTHHESSPGVPESYVDRPVLSPGGWTFAIQSESESTLSGALDLLAIALSGAGGSGRLAPFTVGDTSEHLPRGTRGVVAVLAVEPNTRARGAVALWRGAQDRSEELASLVPAYFSREPAENVISYLLPMSVASSDMEATVQRALADRHPYNAQIRAIQRRGSSVRHMAWTTAGHVLLHTRGPHIDIPGAYAELCDIALAWSERCDFTFVNTTTCSARQDLFYLLRDMRPKIRYPRYYDVRRFLDHELVPDAFGWQTVRREHVRKACDLSGWVVRDIGADMHLVCSEDLTTWQADGLADASQEEVSSLVTNAREDFGGMILHEEPPRDAHAGWLPQQH